MAGLAAERMELIRQVLRKRRVMRVDELCSELDASPATIRRDLAEMDQKGLVRRVHGGAMCLERHIEEPVFDDKAALAKLEKQRIVETAVGYIKPGDHIYLDGGSTVLALAKLLTDMEGITVVTNSLRVASLFSAGGPTVILVGGELRRLSQTFVGPLTSPMLDQLRVDTAFMGTIGISPEEGVTTTDPREAFTKGLVSKHAHKVIMLADHSKLGKVAFARVSTVEEVDILITDRSADPQICRRLKKVGVRVVQA